MSGCLKRASVRSNATLLTVTANGYGKRTDLGNYRTQTRGGKGLIDIKTSGRNGDVVGVKEVVEGQELMMVTSGGVVIRASVADISVIAPMCGLLGTVTGMLWTFRELAYARGLGVAQVNPTDLAGGIFQAMITTAGGLVIGIVATGFYSVFRGMVQRLVVSLEETSDRFAGLISRGE